MLRALLLCVAGLVHLIGYSQTSSQKVDAMLDQAKAIFKFNPDSSKILEDKALILAKKTNYSEGEVRAYFYLGYYYQHISKDYPRAINNYLESIQTSKPKHDSLALGWSLYSHLNTSIILGDFGLLEGSMDFLNEAREIALAINNEYELNQVDFWIYRRLANQGRYLDGLEILDEIVSRAPVGSGQYLNALNSIGVGNAFLGNFDFAKKTYEQVISLSQEYENSMYEDYAFHNLGDLLIKNERWKEAERVLEAVLETKLNRPNKTKRDANLLGTYKDLLLTKLRIDKPNFILTIEDDLESLIPDVKNSNPDYYFKIYPLMAQAYAKIGDDSRSKHYANVFQNDSITYYETQKVLEYETKRDELAAVVSAYYAELDNQRREVRSRNLLLSAIVGLSFLLIVLVSYHFLSKYRVRKMLAQSLEQIKWDD